MTSQQENNRERQACLLDHLRAARISMKENLQGAWFGGRADDIMRIFSLEHILLQMDVVWDARRREEKDITQVYPKNVMPPPGVENVHSLCRDIVTTELEGLETVEKEGDSAKIVLQIPARILGEDSLEHKIIMVKMLGEIVETSRSDLQWRPALSVLQDLLKKGDRQLQSLVLSTYQRLIMLEERKINDFECTREGAECGLLLPMMDESDSGIRRIPGLSLSPSDALLAERGLSKKLLTLQLYLSAAAFHLQGSLLLRSIGEIARNAPETEGTLVALSTGLGMRPPGSFISQEEIGLVTAFIKQELAKRHRLHNGDSTSLPRLLDYLSKTEATFCGDGDTIPGFLMPGHEGLMLPGGSGDVFPGLEGVERAGLDPAPVVAGVIRSLGRLVHPLNAQFMLPFYRRAGSVIIPDLDEAGLLRSAMYSLALMSFSGVPEARSALLTSIVGHVSLFADPTAKSQRFPKEIRQALPFMDLCLKILSAGGARGADLILPLLAAHPKKLSLEDLTPEQLEMLSPHLAQIMSSSFDSGIVGAEGSCPCQRLAADLLISDAICRNPANVHLAVSSQEGGRRELYGNSQSSGGYRGQVTMGVFKKKRDSQSPPALPEARAGSNGWPKLVKRR